MNLFIKVDNINALPSRLEIQEVMWEQANNISHAFDLKEFSSLMLSWNKWLDDNRWGNSNKSFEHINFEFIKEDEVVVDIADDALFVDKRAFYRAVLFICEKANGEISIDELVWHRPNEFRLNVKSYLDCSFNEAVERSLQELSS